MSVPSALALPAFFLPLFSEPHPPDDVRDTFRKHWQPVDMVPAEITSAQLGVTGPPGNATSVATTILQRRHPDLIDIRSHGSKHTSPLLAYLNAAEAFHYVQIVHKFHSQGRDLHEKAVFAQPTGRALWTRAGFTGSVQLRLGDEKDEVVVSQISLDWKESISWSQGTGPDARTISFQPKFSRLSAAAVIRWFPLLVLAARLPNNLDQKWANLRGQAANIAPLSYDPSPLFYQMASAAYRHPGILTQFTLIWALDPLLLNPYCACDAKGKTAVTAGLNIFLRINGQEVPLYCPVIHKDFRTTSTPHTCRVSIDNVLWYDFCGSVLERGQRMVGSPSVLCQQLRLSAARPYRHAANCGRGPSSHSFREEESCVSW
jgi:hypothetical protein